jgi:O-antigen ligase
MKRLSEWFTTRKISFADFVITLLFMWIFLIPFGRCEQGPAALLAITGLLVLIKTKGECATSPAAKGFLLLLALYLAPILISLTDAVSFKAPFRVFLVGIGSGLTGLAILHASENDKDFFKKSALVLAAVVGFWFLDAGIQAVFGRDIFGLVREERLSGPWLKKTQMGYYSGPFSALLLMFALHRNWRPVFQWTLFLFVSIIVLLNNSRGGWVMYGVVAAVFVWGAGIRKLRRKIPVCIVLLLLAAGTVYGLYHASGSFRKRVDQTLLAAKGDRYHLNRSLSKRLPMWIASCDIIKTYPINGVGARNFRKIALDHWPKGFEYENPRIDYPHQVILEYWVGTGIIGVLGLLVSIILCVMWWLKADSSRRRDAAGTGLTLMALYFPLNTHRAYYSSDLSAALWILIALYTAAILSSHSKHEKETLEDVI